MKADPENAKAVFAALIEFGAPLKGLTPVDFEEPGPFFRIGAGRSALTFLWQFRASNLTPHGRAGLKTFLTKKPTCG